jgi:hypothetical protein
MEFHPIPKISLQMFFLSAIGIFSMAIGINLILFEQNIPVNWRV